MQVVHKHVSHCDTLDTVLPTLCSVPNSIATAPKAYFRNYNCLVHLAKVPIKCAGVSVLWTWYRLGLPCHLHHKLLSTCIPALAAKVCWCCKRAKVATACIKDIHHRLGKSLRQTSPNCHSPRRCTSCLTNLAVMSVLLILSLSPCRQKPVPTPLKLGSCDLQHVCQARPTWNLSR